MAFALAANAHVVVDVAKLHSGVGSHGPAMVNQHGAYDGAYNGGWNGASAGYSGLSSGHGWGVGHPNGAPHITLVRIVH